jgi:hypothetical protein
MGLHQRALGDDLQVGEVADLVLDVGHRISRGDVERAVVLALRRVGAADDGLDGDMQALLREQPLVLGDVEPGFVGDRHRPDGQVRLLQALHPAQSRAARRGGTRTAAPGGHSQR